MDAKFGLRYAYLLNDEMNLNVELGYQGTTFVNALQEGSFLVNATIPTVVPDPLGLQGIESNLSYDDTYYNYGPYLTVGMDFL